MPRPRKKAAPADQAGATETFQAVSTAKTSNSNQPQPAEQVLMDATERHGPFLVPSELIKPAGFCCKSCRHPVRVVRQMVPLLLPRICIFACGCGVGVAVWEDECQPTENTWRLNMELARKTGAGMLIFNGGKDTPPEFQGRN